MGYYKKYGFKITIVSILLFYFLSRFFFLSSLPIFTDEAIYLRWAQYLQTDFKFWDYALTDGKQPLFIWLTTAAMYVFKDPLIAGRFVSVLAGFFSMVGLYFLGKLTFNNRRIGLLSAAMYTIYPFAIVYDRMAIYDSLVGTFAVWGLYCTIRFMRQINLNNAVLLGAVTALGTLNKTPSFFNIYLIPFSLLLFNFKKQAVKNRLFFWGVYAAIATALTYTVYNLLRISPFFHIINQKNAIFVYPLSEWIHHPFTYFWDNFWVGQRDWFIKYFGYSFILLFIGSFFIKKEYQREKSLLFIWFIVPFILLALFGKTLYPRYIFFMTLSLLPLVAYTLFFLFHFIKNKLIFCLIILFSLFFPLVTDYFILFDFANASIPSSDVNQYNNDWPSGLGVKEAIKYLGSHDTGERIALYTQGTFGLLPFAVELYLHDNPRYFIKGIWPINSEMPKELLDSAKIRPTYIIFYQPCENCLGKGKAPKDWSVTPVYVKYKPSNDAWLTLYKVNN